MRGRHDPDWAQMVQQWKAEQERLRRMVRIEPLAELPRFVAGADAAFSDDKSTVFAAAVVYDRIDQRIVEVAHATVAAEVPYVPGFLSFREGPALRSAIAKLAHPWGAICFDGQGLAHPRRCGIASHLAVQLDVSGVGLAKSRFIGEWDAAALAIDAGSSVPLMDGDEQIGLVLRTQRARNPIFLSIGHRVDLPTARSLALACCARYRIPEPTRQADIEVGKLKRCV